MHSSKRKSLDFESESYKEGMKMLMKKITKRRWMMRMVMMMRMVRLTKKDEDEDDVGCSHARGTCHPIERGRECKVNK